MKYFKTERNISVGDNVRVEGGVHGLVVCDFETWTCVAGYDEWLSMEKMADGKFLDKGILVKTKEFGMLYYEEEDEDIELER